MDGRTEARTPDEIRMNPAGAWDYDEGTGSHSFLRNPSATTIAPLIVLHAIGEYLLFLCTFFLPLFYLDSTFSKILNQLFQRHIRPGIFNFRDFFLICLHILAVEFEYRIAVIQRFFSR